MAKTHKDRRDVQNPMSKPKVRGEQAKSKSIYAADQELIFISYHGGLRFLPKQ
jgi:hypothetical protein